MKYEETKKPGGRSSFGRWASGMRPAPTQAVWYHGNNLRWEKTKDKVITRSSFQDPKGFSSTFVFEAASNKPVISSSMRHAKPLGSRRGWTLTSASIGQEVFQVERHTTLKRWLTMLMILFAPPFLAVGAMRALSWLLDRLFPSVSLLARLGIEEYAVAVLGMPVLLSAGLMGLMVHRWRQGERWQGGVTPPLLTAIAVPLAMPFLALPPLALIMRLSHQLVSNTSSTAWWFFGIVGAYPFLSAWLLSTMARYVTISLVALVLSSTALIRLIMQERRQIWRCEHFYASLIAFAGVLAFPLLMRYQPAVRAAPGVELRLVERPGPIEGAVRDCQAAAEVRGCQYEPLGWADAQTLVYRQWCDGRYEMGVWHPGDSRPPQAYHLDTDEVTPFEADLDALTRETCAPSICVLPALAKREPFEPGYYPGRYEDALISPNGRWVAFTAEHVYGPEDLIVTSHN
jgi:hypothetical protein